MQLDLRRVSDTAGRGVAADLAVERLRQIARAVFSEALAALDIDTLRRDPARFHAAAHAVERALDALSGRDADNRS